MNKQTNYKQTIILSKNENPQQERKSLHTWPNNWLQKFIIPIESRFLSGRSMVLLKPKHNSRVCHQLVKNIIISKLETPQLEITCLSPIGQKYYSTQTGNSISGRTLLHTWPNNWLQKFIISIESRFLSGRSMGPFEA